MLIQCSQQRSVSKVCARYVYS